jgi:uncharacterized protein (DUF983 family)
MLRSHPSGWQCEAGAGVAGEATCSAASSSLPHCDACSLDYSFADPADGPAFFVMMTGAVPATAFGIWLELTYSPPLWVHAVTTLPIVLIACTLPLRFFKGWLVAE